MIFRRVIYSSGGNNGALAGHQPGYGTERSHGSRIGERNGGAFKILNRQLIASGTRHDIIERFDILREIQRAAVFNVRDL